MRAPRAAAGVSLLLPATFATDRQWWPPGDRTGVSYLHWPLVGVFDVSLSILAVAVLAAAHGGRVLLLPRAEEPHLRARFGREYDRDAAAVPRFVGRGTVRALRSGQPGTGQESRSGPSGERRDSDDDPGPL